MSFSHLGIHGIEAIQENQELHRWNRVSWKRLAIQGNQAIHQ